LGEGDGAPKGKRPQPNKKMNPHEVCCCCRVGSVVFEVYLEGAKKTMSGGWQWIGTVINGWRVILSLCSLFLLSDHSLAFGFGLPCFIFLQWLSQRYFKTPLVLVILFLLFFQICLLWAVNLSFISEHLPSSHPLHHFSNYIISKNELLPMTTLKGFSWNLTSSLSLSSSSPRPPLLVYPKQQLITQSSLNFTDSHFTPSLHLPQITSSHFKYLFGDLPTNDFPDLKYRSTELIKKTLPQIFHDLPSHFNSSFKNPCWFRSSRRGGGDERKEGEGEEQRQNRPRIPLELFEADMLGMEGGLTCLPYLYILGQPKAGSSDLWSRLTSHPQIHAPQRKEVCLIPLLSMSD
jgi:hypothetical protein